MQSISKRNTLLRSLTESVFDPHATDFWLQKINPIWSTHRALAKIVRKENVAADTVSLTLEPNRQVNLGQPGQHHPVRVKVQGRLYERNYSLTERDNTLVLTVKKVADGIVSRWLVEDSQVGQVIELGQPFGDMLIPAQSRVVMLAAGSGITPMLSLIEGMQVKSQLQHTPVDLMYWVKRHEDAAFLNVFEALAAQYPLFKFHVFYTQDQEHDSRLNVTHLAAIDDLDQSTVYACGPSGFVATAEDLFGHAQVFMSEAFSMSAIDTNETGFINVTLTQSNKTVAIPKGQSILAGLEQANVKPTYGCRMGICNKCACQKATGATKNLLNASENAEPNNLLKICVNSAKSDLVIDL